jgi:hypothetical protein
VYDAISDSIPEQRASERGDWGVTLPVMQFLYRHVLFVKLALQNHPCGEQNRLIPLPPNTSCGGISIINIISVLLN